MGFHKSLAIILVVLPFTVAQAGECDELYRIAKGNVLTAKTFRDQKNFPKAEEVYMNAARQFEQAAGMTDCSSKKVQENANRNAEYCRAAASKLREAVNKGSARLEINEDYTRAKQTYNQGIAHMKKHEWNAAISSFDEAVPLLEQVAAMSPESSKGKKAAEMAGKAREAAATIRDYKKRNLYR